MRNPSLMGALLLAACASSPDYQPPAVVMPAAFREASVVEDTTVGKDTARADTVVPPARQLTIQPPDSGYWRQLGDTTLDRLVGELLHENLDVRTAEARVRGARAARTNAKLDFVPAITFAAGYTRQRLATATFPGQSGPFPDQDIWDAGFDAGWEIDIFGRVRKNVRAQGALIEAAEEDVRNVQVILTAELARNYFELRGAQQQLAVARLNAENQRQSLQVTQDRLDAGKGTAFDTERAKAQVSTTLASIPTLEAQVAASQYSIGVLVGRPPAAVAAELVDAVELPSPPDSVELLNPDSLIKLRPDVAAAERQFAAGQALVGAAKADYWPRLTVGGSAGFTSDLPGSLGNEGTFRYAVGPVISWPALNLGRVKASVDASRAQADAAQAQYTQVVLAAMQDVETSLSRYRTARARLDRLDDAAASSERAAELARLRFSEGVTDFLQVLDAERTQLDAQTQAALGRTDAATAYAALFKALGGVLPDSGE